MKHLRWCGWAALATHDRTNNPAAFLIGPLPGAKQTVPRAEHLAVICPVEKMEGRSAEGDAVINTDCAYV